jgi:hypothetical protein
MRNEVLDFSQFESKRLKMKVTQERVIVSSEVNFVYGKV